MPFAVSKWPYSPDPRTGIFGGHGWDDVDVPPWVWLMKTSGATGPWTSLNTGIPTKVFFESPFFVGYSGASVDLSVQTQVHITTFEPPLPSGNTIRIFPQVVEVSTGRGSNALREFVYPQGIQVFGSFVMVDAGTGIPDPDFPNPVTITPQIWNTPSL